MKILVMGLPGSGKTTLAIKLAQLLRAVHFNADLVRATVSKDLGFSVADRIEQARRMGALCDSVDGIVIADFICPTPECRAAFGHCDLLIWMDTIKKSRYPATDDIFVPPTNADIVHTVFPVNPTKELSHA